MRRGRTGEFLQPREARTEDHHECAPWTSEVKLRAGFFMGSSHVSHGTGTEFGKQAFIQLSKRPLACFACRALSCSAYTPWPQSAGSLLPPRRICALET